MARERDYQNAVEVGKRNQEVKVLIQNWCGHARIEKFGGVGMIEAATGLPIGHHWMACDHAPAGGHATWNLENAALEFYDRNCVSCNVRQPLRLPNLVELVRRRDQQVAKRVKEKEREERKLHDEFDSRQKERDALQSNATAPSVALIEDLQLLDQTRTESASTKIIATARLAPEVFSADIVEHLFRLVEANESWAVETALTCLRTVSPDHKRLVACAMQSLSLGHNTKIVAEILLAHLDLVDASQVPPAVRSLCFLAAPPRIDFDYSKPEKRPEALQALASRFPPTVEKALDDLIACRSGTDVKAAARALPLVFGDVAYPSGLVRSLAAKLSRVDSLVDSDRDSEIDKVAHELERALVHAMLNDDRHVDTLLAGYYQGASNEGEARLVGVYSRLLRLPGNRFESVDPIPNLRPYETALRRVLTLVSSTKNQEVIEKISEALRHFPEQLAKVAHQQMELLLGTAALVDQALTDFMKSPVSPEEENDFWGQMDRSNQRQRLAGLRAAILDWASSAAAADPAAAGKFIDFIASDIQWPEQFRSALVKALPPLMHTASSTNAVLPFLYGAMVGESALVRMAAAWALQELRGSRVNDLPSLVHDAFLLLLSDPIIGVHQSAVEALERTSFPEEYKGPITARLIALFTAYVQQGGGHDAFLVTCIDLLTSRMHLEADFTRNWGRIFVAALMNTEDTTLLRHGRAWMLKRLVNVEGFPDLLLKLLRSAERNEYHDDHLIPILRDLPREALLNMQANLVSLFEKMPNDRVLPAACIEAFSSADAWDGAEKIARNSHAAVADSARMRVRKQYAQLTVLAVEFEKHLAEGRRLDALGCAGRWRRILEEMEHERGIE